MDTAHTLPEISLQDFNQLLAEYPYVVLPKLADLDEARYSTIPRALAERKAAFEAAERQGSSGSFDPPALKKDELVTLVEWKLSHGTFRPSLKKLAESNSEDDVSICTTAGFANFNPNLDRYIAGPLRSLSDLKGVGPATASLLLSVWDPQSAPFFSDELFRWALYDANPGKGWDRSIKYTPKEYLELVTKVSELIKRLSVRAVDAEKVAFVLGRRATGKSAETLTAAKGPTSATSKTKRKAEILTQDGRQVVEKVQTKASPIPKKRKKSTKEKVPFARVTRSSARLQAAN